jgi:hypothetical protein
MTVLMFFYYGSCKYTLLRNFLGGIVPFDQLPILEVDGKILAKSATICKYVARETGRYELLVYFPCMHACMECSRMYAVFRYIL